MVAGVLALLVVGSAAAAGLAVAGAGAAPVAGTVADAPPADEALLVGDTGRQQARPIDSCTVVTEPGRYELTGDITNTSAEVCLHVRASDVTIDGNGHTVAGGDAARSAGVFVYNGTMNESVGGEDQVSNVTVRDIRVTNWGYGVRAGTVSDGGSDVTVRNVVARDNARDGVHMWFIGSPVIENVTVVRNGNGVFLREVQGATVRDVNASYNDGYGVHLSDVVTDGSFTGITATHNGAGADRGGGIYLSTDAYNNTFARVHVAHNDGPGVEFSDSSGNVLRDAVVESNAGPGILSNPANADLLQNVTVRDNAGGEVEVEFGSFAAEGLGLGDTASVSFAQASLSIDLVPAGELPDPPGTPASEYGVRLVNLASPVTLTFPLENASGTAELYRYDGTEWVRIENATVDPEADTISGTVTSSGVVLPVVRSGDQQQDGAGSDQQAGTGVSGTDAVFEILSTSEDADFTYQFTVEGTVEPTQTEDVSADAGDTIQPNGDGTVTVTGSTGDGAGDAFLVSGEILSFSLQGAEDGYRLVFDGEDVTDRLVSPDEDGDPTTPTTETPTTDEPTTETPTTEEPADDTGVSGTDAVFEVLSTSEDADFTYQFTVEGTVEPATTEDVSADSGDAIAENEDGTVTVTGSTENAAGDAFRVTGEILSFSLSGAAEGYRLVFDGEDVTDVLVPAGGDESATFVVRSTADGNFGYVFVVEGSVEPTATGDVSADAGDQVVESSDGTVTVVGSTGSRAGDAFAVTGEITAFYTPAPADEYVLLLDGEDVTDTVPGP